MVSEVRPISMTNILMRDSSPGLFAGGVKEITRMCSYGSEIEITKIYIPLSPDFLSLCFRGHLTAL